MPYISLSSDYKKINLEWYDHNGETGKNYILEKSTDNREWSPAKVFEGGNDYSFGETIVYEETISCTSSVRFRIIATSYKDTPSIYSRTVSITRAADTGVPVCNARAFSTKIIILAWARAPSARASRP